MPGCKAFPGTGLGDRECGAFASAFFRFFTSKRYVRIAFQNPEPPLANSPSTTKDKLSISTGKVSFERKAVSTPEKLQVFEEVIFEFLLS